MEVVLVFRYLLIVFVVILNLNFQIKGIIFLFLFIFVFIGILFDLLFVLVIMSELFFEFLFIWLDGVVKYLEELGSYLCLYKCMLNRDYFYLKLIELYLKVIGKCILL